MEFNVSHLLKSAVGTTREYELDTGEKLTLDEERIATLTAGHVRFDRTNDGILVRGNLEAAVAVNCARCLEPTAVTIASELAEEFEPTVDIATGRPLPSSSNELAFPIDDRHILDLGEAVRQNLLGALPIQPLCRPDCAGLCPVCGANHNLEACACVVEEVNRPFAGLAELLREGTGI